MWVGEEPGENKEAAGCLCHCDVHEYSYVQKRAVEGV